MIEALVNIESYKKIDLSGQNFVRTFLERHNITECVCHRCIEENDVQCLLEGFSVPVNMCMMILCPICGNKRCPHASDHRLNCTNSNEPGQVGSVYPKVK